MSAALAGFDLGEAVTIPSLPDMAEWQARHEATYVGAVQPNPSHDTPVAHGVA